MEALDGVIGGECGWEGGRDWMASSTFLKEVPLATYSVSQQTNV